MWIHCLLCTHVQECRDENYYYNSTNFTFCQGQEHKTTFLFFSWTFWYSPLEFSSRKIHQHLTIVWDGISAINFEAAQIRSLSDDFVAIAVYFSRFIHQQIVAWTNKNNNDCMETNRNQLFQIRPNTAFYTTQTSYKQTFIFDRSMASRSRGTTWWQRCWAVC